MNRTTIIMSAIAAATMFAGCQSEDDKSQAQRTRDAVAFVYADTPVIGFDDARIDAIGDAICGLVADGTLESDVAVGMVGASNANELDAEQAAALAVAARQVYCADAFAG